MPYLSTRKEIFPLNVLDGGADVHGHRTRFGVRHETARTEDPADATDLGHDLRHGDADVEVGPTALYLVDEFVEADEIGAGVFSFLFLVGSDEGEYALGLTGAVGQGDRTPQGLVGLPRVDAQADVHVDRSVEFGEVDLFHEGHCLFERIEPLIVHFLVGGFALLG